MLKYVRYEIILTIYVYTIITETIFIFNLPSLDDKFLIALKMYRHRNCREKLVHQGYNTAKKYRSFLI